MATNRKKDDSDQEQDSENNELNYDSEEDDDSSGSSSDEDDDGQVILEGVAKNIDESDDEEHDEEEPKEPLNKKLKSNHSDFTGKKKKQKKASKKKDTSVDIVNVEFLFRDMDECFFHGLKTLLCASNPIHAIHSSELTDIMIENVSVGTIVSNDDECVFGFASVLPLSSYLSSTNESLKPSSCIQYLKKQCLNHCPSQHLEEMKIVLSGTTKRPAGFFIHGRMINLPLEITLVLHEQLVMDMDWAVENAEGGEVERKALDFGAFVLFAPCYLDEQQSKRRNNSSSVAKKKSDDSKLLNSSSVIYKHFDDEIFASHAEFTFSFETPKSFATEEKQICTIIVITKTAHREAMKEMKRMIGK